MSPVRDRRRRQPHLRRVSHDHQRDGVPHPHGLLPQDVLRDPRLAGLEHERFAHRQAHGVAGVHRLLVLVTHRVLLAHGGLRAPAGVAGAGEGLHRVRPPAQLVLQPVPVRDLDQTVQEGLCDDM